MVQLLNSCYLWLRGLSADFCHSFHSICFNCDKRNPGFSSLILVNSRLANSLYAAFNLFSGWRSTESSVPNLSTATASSTFRASTIPEIKILN